MAYKFAKMHGLGNDFVIIDGVSAPPPQWEREKIAVLADRRRGIGFDQLLLLLPPPSGSDADFEYKIFNADGGEVGQCGNGARCAHAFALRQGLCDKRRVVLQTFSTRIVTETVADGQVRASMPPSVFLPTVGIAGYCFHHLTLGNPHYVSLDGEVPVETAQAVGRVVNEEVAGGVNVGFGRVHDGEITLRVYERGAGLTDACGSGAVAAAAAAARAGLCGNEVRVRMPGGDLLCGTDSEGGVFLQGEVAHVFEGVVW